jgi:glyoxylase-like metal-dependent hydrolase (beta-lactamase superfamily II)
MVFEQFYLECLSQASYLVGDKSSGKAVVVDPRRDVQEYIDAAASHGLTITHVLETHFHADFLSGHLEMAKATGAKIVYGSKAKPQFAATLVEDGERLSLGEVVLEFRHTPGHTPESMSIVVFEKASDTAPYGVLTGDTMFIGDVGRPDLLVSVGKTTRPMAPARPAARTSLLRHRRQSASSARPTTRCSFPTWSRSLRQ